MSSKTKYTNESFSGGDMIATITMLLKDSEGNTKTITKILGEISTLSYSIHMEKKPVRSIGNVNAKDYIIGPRTIAGSLVFTVFNKHFSKEIMKEVNEQYTNGKAYLVDELPPFDITISAANEYGIRSRLAIYGVRLLSEGQVMSINDIYTENTYQYFATDVEYFNDELTYARDGNTGLYKLNDNLSFTQYNEKIIKGYSGQFAAKFGGAYKDKIISNKQKYELIRNKQQQEEHLKYINRSITLKETIVQPVKTNKKGIVNFTLDPIQTGGFIYIINEQDKSIQTLFLDDTKTNRGISCSLAPGDYSAYYYNKETNKKSNEVKLIVNIIKEENVFNRFNPIIERLTANSITIYSNSANHNKCKVYNDNFNKVVDINSNTAFINELTPNTEYNIVTYNDIENIYSNIVTIITRTEYYADFKELTDFVFNNCKRMKFPEKLNSYKDLIIEAETLWDETKDVTEALISLKNKYQKIYNKDKNNSEALLNIYKCNEIIFMSIKLNNNKLKAINEKIDVPIPTVELNEQYQNVITFDESITSADFFRLYNNSEQLYYSVKKDNFKEIDGKKNSFLFNGHPGYKHYVRALIGDVASEKVFFYVMTEEEKKVIKNKESLQNKLTQKEKEIIDTQIDTEYKQTDSIYKRSFMIKSKTINNPLFLPPTILSIDKNVLVQSEIHDSFCSDIENIFYLVIANYEDVINDSDVYKIQFTNKDDYISILKLNCNLEDDKEYIIWIEDDNYNQISNPTSFIYNKDFDKENDDLIALENKDIINNITNACNDLSNNVKENIVSSILNNQEIENSILYKMLLKQLFDNEIDSYEYYLFLYNIKQMFVLNVDINKNILSNIQYNNGLLTFNCLDNISLVLFNYKDKTVNIEKINALEENIINTADKDKIVLIAINNNMNMKSDIIYIDNKNKTMEVI